MRKTRVVLIMQEIRCPDRNKMYTAQATMGAYNSRKKSTGALYIHKKCVIFISPTNNVKKLQYEKSR